MIFSTTYRSHVVSLETTDRKVWVALIDGGHGGGYSGSLSECEDWFGLRGPKTLSANYNQWRIFKAARKWLAGEQGTPGWAWR